MATGQCTSLDHKSASRDLFVEFRLPFGDVNDNRTVISPCLSISLRFNFLPALYAVISLCRIVLSTLTVSCLLLEDETTSNLQISLPYFSAVVTSYL